MLKRGGPLIMMALGALLIAASVVYWRTQQALAEPTAAQLPASLAGAPLVRASYGPQAVAEVTRLHGKTLPLSSGAMGMYGEDARVTLWVSGAPLAAMAARMVREMAAAIAEGASPFTPLGVRAADGREVYALTGMGQRHFYFQSGALVVWLAAEEGLAEAALAETLEFYP